MQLVKEVFKSVFRASHVAAKVIAKSGIIDDKELKQIIATKVLRDLPEWFGIEEATQHYIDGVVDLPFWASEQDGEYCGFIALQATSNATAEIFVMAIQKLFHRKRIGTQLLQAIEKYARDAGFRFLQVKTVQMGRYAEYDRTNQFYLANDFHELECFPEMWDSWNPCQIYVKWIG